MRRLTLLFSVLALGACDSRTTSTSPSRTASARTPDALGALPAPDPVARWKGQAIALFPAEVAASIANERVDRVDTRPDAGGDGVRHLWPSARVIEYAGMKVPRKTVMALKGLRSGMTRERFDSRFFTVLDDAQRRQFEAQVDARTAQGDQTPEQAAQVKGLAVSLLRTTPAQAIEHVGDAAAWEPGKQGGHLHVLIGQSQFTIEADVSDDPDANREAAITAVRAVMERMEQYTGLTP